jgi:SAM-dependent methyltransferase
MYENVRCPSCHGGQARLILCVTATEAAQHFVLRSAEPERHQRLIAHIRSLWRGDTGQVFKCGACGFGFSWPFVAGDAEFYDLAYSNLGYPRMKWEFTRTLKALQSRDVRGKTAIEIGAGFGYFLDLVTDKLFNPFDIAAIEYNKTSLAMLRAKGYAAVSDDLLSEAFDGRKAAFDFIFMFQVVEHMDRLDGLFGRLHTLLKAGGSAFIAVPTQTRIDYQEAHGSLVDMPPNHVGRWTRRAFETVSERCGLSVSAAEVEPFNAWKFLKQDVYYSHIRRAQKPGSLSGRVRSLRRGKARKAAEAAVAALSVPSRLPAWSAAFANRANMGGSLWVQIDRHYAYDAPAL